MLLELKNIHKSFAGKKQFTAKNREVVKAVDDVSLSIAAGENMGLVGESGCGKTTLARIIMKLQPPDRGEIFFDGEDISLLSGHRQNRIRENMQMVFQDPYSSLDPRFTVRNILQEAMCLQKKKYKSKAVREKRMKQLLASVNLDQDSLQRYPHEFSGGERQRIAIARALVLNPRLLILDEAVSSLDVIIQKQLVELFLDLQKQFGLTYLFISHNLKIAKKISQKIAVMCGGRIVELGRSCDLFENPFHPYTKKLLAAATEYKDYGEERIDDTNLSGSLRHKGKDHWVLE